VELFGSVSARTRRTMPPIAWAFLLSLLFHLLLFSVLEIGIRWHWWRPDQVPAWLQLVKRPTPNQLAEKKKPNPEQELTREVPMLFVDVDPDQASPAPPKESRFYSDRSTLAANPNPLQDSKVPKLDGKQTQVPKNEDVARTKPQPLQPAPPVAPVAVKPAPKPEPQPPPKQEVAAAKPDPAPKSESHPAPGDMLMAKPAIKPEPKELAAVKPPEDTKVTAPAPVTEPTPTPVKERPRTLAEVKNRLAGQAMKQEGGVRRVAAVPQFDVTATPFGAYDRAIVAAIEARWYDLLDEYSYARNRTGKVVLAFHLNYNGTVSNLKLEEYDVGDVLALICQKAVSDPAPYAVWPSDLRRLIGADFREVKFTFYYN